MAEIIDAWAIATGMVYDEERPQAMHLETAAAQPAPGWVNFLLAFDVDYRKRHLHFMIQGQNRLYQVLLNNYKPKVCAALIDPAAHSDFGLGTARLGFDVLVVDAPGWSDERALRLAAIADLMVLPATPTVADLRPTIRLMHELKGQGIPDSREVIAFNHVRAARELTFARTYLKEAGLTALPKSIRELLGYRTVQNVGRGITEAAAATVKKEAKEMMVLIDKMLQEAGPPQTEERFKLEEERFSLTASPSAGKPKKRR